MASELIAREEEEEEEAMSLRSGKRREEGWESEGAWKRVRLDFQQGPTWGNF